MFGPEAFPVTDTIWCVRRASYLTCSYIMRTPEGPVLIDAGMDSSGRDMRLGLAKMDLSVESVRGILLTHWHNDHAAGAAEIQSASGAPVYCHPLDAGSLTRKTARAGLRGWLADRVPEWGLFVLFKGLLGEATPRGVAAPRLVSDGEVLFDDFEVVETLGHTPGHVSYYYRPERALFAGDALAVVGGRVRFMARPVTPDMERAREAMAKCLALDIDVLCPGHRAPLTEDASARCQEMLSYVRSGGKWPLLG